MKSKKVRGFFDQEYRLEKIAIKDPLEILSTKVNWEQFRKKIEKAYENIDYSQGGRPPYDRLMMFKILILQEYYGLSDDQIEFQLLDRLSFQKFIGQGLHDTVPDAKTIWLYRQTLTEARTLDELFVYLKRQLEGYGLIAKKGVMVDASFAHVPVQRNTPDENDQLKNDETPDWSENKMRQKDTDANWTKKGGQSHYGYKQHIKADVESKIVTNFEVTSASEHDSQLLNNLLESSDQGQSLYGDSAYMSEKIIAELADKGIKQKILAKGYRNTELTKKERERNQRLSSKRCRVEHIFGWIKQKSGRLIRGIGIKRVTARITLRLFIYNLSRATFLIKDRKRGLTII